MKTDIYTMAGKKSGSIELPESVFGLPWNKALVYQIVVGMEANARTSVAHVKTRGEVRGGGKKPWRQKGTGRARHGSIRSPIWKGGGVTHGPRNDKDYSQKLNKKMRIKALYTALSQKFREGKLLFVESLAFAEPKSSLAKKVLGDLGGIQGFENMLAKNKNSALIATATNTPAVVKSFRNFGNAQVVEARNLNPVDVLKYTHLIIADPAQSVATIVGRSEKKVAAPKEIPAAAAPKVSVKKKTAPAKAAKKVAAKKTVKAK